MTPTPEALNAALAKLDDVFGRALKGRAMNASFARLTGMTIGYARQKVMLTLWGLPS